MKILLIGEYSNVHWTLAESFRKMGHEVTVVSEGDGWKGYRRDIDIPVRSKWKFLKFLIFSFFKGTFKKYDIVQVVNYQFIISGKYKFINKWVFNYLKRYNNKVFLAAYGTDYYYLESCLNKKLRYSPFDSKDYKLNEFIISEHFTEDAKSLNNYIAEKCDGIISCMFDYYIGYKDLYEDKLTNIPLPIDLGEIDFEIQRVKNSVPKIFVGVQGNKSAFKGTDLILSVLSSVKERWGDNVEIEIVESVPFETYKRLYSESDIFFDQIYSYSSGMNGLMALAHGKVLFGGGEPDSYQIINEPTNFPIVNITADKKDMIEKIEIFLQNKVDMDSIKKKSREFIQKHHDSNKVAIKYLDVYNK